MGAAYRHRLARVEAHHSPTWLGAIAAADLLPAVFLAPFAGVAADRTDPLRIMWITQAIIMVHALALWLMTATGRSRSGFCSASP